MMTIKRKAKVMKPFMSHETNTGAPAVQVAVLSERIKMLTEHLKIHKKDVSSRMGLLKMVSARRKLLNYIKRKNVSEYEALIAKLELRK